MKKNQKFPSYPILIGLALLLGLAPFYPKPHLVEKLDMLMDGTLARPIDFFDLVWHTLPFALLAYRVAADLLEKGGKPGKGMFAFGIVLALLVSSGCEGRKGVPVGREAPAIAARDLNGKNVSLADLKGKTVVLYFWRHSCCGARIKDLEAIYRRNEPKGLAILAINEMSERDEVVKFARDSALTFPIVYDQDADLQKLYRVRGFPTVFIVDRYGVVKERVLGEIEGDQLEKLVQRQFEMQEKAKQSYEKVHTGNEQ